MKIDGKKSDMKMYKVLGQGLKTMMDFQWKPGQWNVEPDGKKSDNACGIGLHVWKNKPNWSVVLYLPDHTYLVEEVKELLGEDKEKARYKKVKISLLPLSLVDLLGQDRKGLSGADLNRADLSPADLSRADLYGAYLNGAYLNGADLNGANLNGADLSRADLYGAHGIKENMNISEEQKKSAHC